MDRSGVASCSWEDTAFEGVGDLFTVGGGTAYALVAERVMKYQAPAWIEFAEVDVGLSGAIWADEQSIVVTAYQQFLARGDVSGGFQRFAGLPAGDYSDVWGFGAAIWLANKVGHLVHFDGAAWRVIDTGIGDEILGLWGSPDKMLYFISPRDFGRWDGEKVELFAKANQVPSQIRFTDIWGNSATEVFIGVRDDSLRDYKCSGAFTLWFDGNEFRMF